MHSDDESPDTPPRENVGVRPTKRGRMSRRFVLVAGILIVAVLAGGLLNEMNRQRWSFHPLALGVIGVASAALWAVYRRYARKRGDKRSDVDR